MNTERNTREPVLVSACLLGLPTRYNGEARSRESVLKLAESHCLIPICPEQLGGLPTPRPHAEITRGDGGDVLDGAATVVNEEGREVTAQFLSGARIAQQVAAVTGARRALLKEGSPSCGVRRIKRNDQDVEGCGVTTALLRRKGIQIDGIE
ncbi:MAG: DUF523 domain-containing protein [Planctomycetes bacterium]|nr:DUF523 domain-containing protein [Planctomycetota bacterium]